ncbi:TPA: ELM1/GtrOC1 family putative glycosyltransferase [Acinetobacter baumannii]|uniref:ELM1/GtrOC1 family putative glycosyltransferase n=1 Tax=Acinetobacter baumannii TaxID=470 RepID=UPI00338FAD7D
MKTQQLSSNTQVIIALTDSKAGHETQTHGIIQLLNQNQTYKVEWIRLGQPNKWLYRLLRWLLNFRVQPHWLRYFISADILQHLSDLPVAYIISSGGNTLIANVLLKKYFLEKNQNVKNIVASSLRGIAPNHFDVVFTVHEQQASLEHYLYYPIAPNKMTATSLTQAQARENLAISPDEQVITVLIGADSKNVHIGSARKWAETLLQVRNQFPKARILLTTSRRTTIEFERELHKLGQQLNVFQKQDQMTWIAQGQACDIKNYIKAADWVLCSQDSTSMMAEIIMAQKPLAIMYHQCEMKDILIENQLSMLEHMGWLNRVDENTITQIENYLDRYSIVDHVGHLGAALRNQLKKSETRLNFDQGSQPRSKKIV